MQARASQNLDHLIAIVFHEPSDSSKTEESNSRVCRRKWCKLKRVQLNSPVFVMSAGTQNRSGSTRVTPTSDSEGWASLQKERPQRALSSTTCGPAAHQVRHCQKCSVAHRDLLVESPLQCRLQECVVERRRLTQSRVYARKRSRESQQRRTIKQGGHLHRSDRCYCLHPPC